MKTIFPICPLCNIQTINDYTCGFKCPTTLDDGPYKPYNNSGGLSHFYKYINEYIYARTALLELRLDDKSTIISISNYKLIGPNEPQPIFKYNPLHTMGPITIQQIPNIIRKFQNLLVFL